MEETGIIIEPDWKFDTDGDTSVQDAHEQNTMHILLAEKGNFYGSVLVGVGIGKFQNATLTDPRDFVMTVTKELENDGQSNIEIVGTTDGVNITSTKRTEFKQTDI